MIINCKAGPNDLRIMAAPPNQIPVDPYDIARPPQSADDIVIRTATDPETTVTNGSCETRAKIEVYTDPFGEAACDGDRPDNV
jgi:hypothetical protein